jgi:hypothetical protein
MTGSWRELHNEELHNLYSSPSRIRMIRSRVRWACHVESVEERRNAYWNLVERKDHLEDLDICERTIIKWFSEK